MRPILTRILRTGAPLEVLLSLACADGRLDMNPFLRPEKWPPVGEPLGPPALLDAYCATYERAGFRGGINWYRNVDRNAAEHPDVGTRALDVPCLMLTAEWDPGLRPEFAEPMRALCSDLELHHVEQVGPLGAAGSTGRGERSSALLAASRRGLTDVAPPCRRRDPAAR